MAKAMSSDLFIQRAKSVHGDEYDYSETKYINMKHKVRIICPEHGPFEQLPQPHLRGQGCPICGREKYKQVMIEKYGVDNPMKNRGIYQKARNTCLQKYGHEWVASLDEMQKKIEDTNLQKYGVSRPIQNADIYGKMQNTVESRYGVSNVGQVSEFRDKMKKTCSIRYGVEEPLSSLIVRRKIDDTKLQNNTFNKSSLEDNLYQILCDIFGNDDVKRQYKSDEYPFACDFYIKSRDMYIELNAHWTHGFHWYNSSDKDDVSVVNKWLDKGTSYYRAAVDKWTVSDVKRRLSAHDNHLNYIVFWDNDLRDVSLWISLGCPDGHDYDYPYSWSD